MSSRFGKPGSNDSKASNEPQIYSRDLNILQAAINDEEVLPDDIIASKHNMERYATEIENCIDANNYGAINLDEQELRELYTWEKLNEVEDYHADFNLEQSFNYNFGVAIGKAVQYKTRSTQGKPDMETIVESVFEDEYYDHLRDPSMMIMKKGAYIGQELVEKDAHNRYRLQD